jgi:preprotein translocase subunit SecF
MHQIFSALFNDHPNSVGESYGSHLVSASRFAFKMIFGGIACLLHALFPFLFIKTASALITQLHDSMVTHRHKSQVSQKN